VEITDEQFERFIGQALDELPEKYVGNMQNVAITYEDAPTPRQREQLKLHCNETLFGLYEGIPLTQRNAGYNLVLPDKITLFKLPLFYATNSEAELKKQIKHTLWHEIAHHFGLDHDRIHSLERKLKVDD
jgi:predicted Zn-dependent protease with MMP-like domain